MAGLTKTLQRLSSSKAAEQGEGEEVLRGGSYLRQSLDLSLVVGCRIYLRLKVSPWPLRKFSPWVKGLGSCLLHTGPYDKPKSYAKGPPPPGERGETSEMGITDHGAGNLMQEHDTKADTP